MSICNEHLEEIKQEELQEIREEPTYIWIRENKELLKERYIEEHPDDFEMFCKAEYKEIV